MTARPAGSTASCGECGSPLHGDQRYCLRCGARLKKSVGVKRRSRLLGLLETEKPAALSRPD